MQSATKINQRFSLIVLEDNKFFLDANCNINEFANLLGTNRTYASRFIHQKFGVSFPTFLNRLRLTHFMKLREENPNLSINSVIRHCGFNTAYSFRRAFVQAYGENPSNYFDTTKYLQ